MIASLPWPLHSTASGAGNRSRLACQASGRRGFKRASLRGRIADEAIQGRGSPLATGLLRSASS
jgi:hypothetical protein